MKQTIAITPKGQIHIPVDFRKILGLTAPGLAEIKISKKGLIIKPKKSPILELAGKYKNKKPIIKINLEKIREKIDYSSL